MLIEIAENGRYVQVYTGCFSKLFGLYEQNRMYKSYKTPEHLAILYFIMSLDCRLWSLGCRILLVSNQQMTKKIRKLVEEETIHRHHVITMKHLSGVLIKFMKQQNVFGYPLWISFHWG